MGARFSFVRRSGAVLAVLAALGPTLSQGADSARVTCAATDITSALNLDYDSGTLTATDAAGSIVLAASVTADASGMFNVTASGVADVPMPELALLDLCLTEKLTHLGLAANNTDDLAYVSNLCRLDLAPKAVPQSVTATYTITAYDAKEAQVFIQRQYRAPSKVTGNAITLDEFPPRQCSVIVAP
jgi:hypothetical protein